MNKSDLYHALIEPIPYNAINDYRANLRLALKRYLSLVKQLDDGNQPKDFSSILSIIHKSIKKINQIALNSYKGLPSTAGKQLSNLMKDYGNCLLYKEITTGTRFYRMRTIADRRNNILHTEMFHIPLNMRRKISAQRFSTPGYPCLYMGMSAYTCWEEMGRPRMSDCWVSCLKSMKPITLLDLRVPTIEDFNKNIENYLVLFPLIISSMLPIENTLDIYKPEYIIPQLLTEWIIKNKKDGIYYTSVHKDSGFDFPEDKYYNIAMPVQDPLQNNVYCKILSSYFQITTPINNEIETLKNGQSIDCGTYDNDEYEQKKVNYRCSEFGKIEDWLRLEKFQVL